jgi:hypothetical protein
MSYTKFEMIVKMLQKMIVGNINNRTFGICYNLDDLLYHNDVDADGYDVVNILSKGWEHHTGKEGFPVPYSRDESNWEHGQLQLRRELMSYIIDKIKASTISYDEMLANHKQSLELPW